MVTLLGILSWLAMRIAVGFLQRFLQDFFLGLKLWMDFLFWLFELLVVVVLLMLMMMLLMLLLRL